MQLFPHLFSPVKIGNLRLRNRLVMAPMALNYSTERGRLVERQIDYYVERARGGAGMIVSEASYICLEGRAGVNRLGLHTDEVVPEHRRLVEAIHRENTPIMIQLQHAGRIVNPKAVGQYPASASAVPLLVKGEHYVGVIPRALTIPEIEELLEMYGRAARRAVDAGYDAILIHACHGYLLNQFLSPRTNRRTDRYGGSDENRARLPIEVVRRVRQAVGPEYPLSIRLTGEEHFPDGYGADFTCRVAGWLEEAGASEISIAGGNYDEIEWLCGPRTLPEGHNVHVAQRVKAGMKILVSVAGRIKRPEMADRIIAEGSADIIWMGRALMADPYLPKKAEEGRLEEIRECLSCNLCITRLLEGLEAQCTLNPESGREREMRLVPAERPRRVLVVGGGPAGMEAARVAAARGHRVTLAERSDRLGGQLLLAAAAPHAEELGKLARYLERQVERAGVEILKNTEITAPEVEELRPEVVVLAAGGEAMSLEIPGAGLPHVFAAPEVLAGKVDGRLGHRVAVIGGGLTGVYTAEYLLERGHRVTVVEMMEWLMPDGNFVDQKTLSVELCERGTSILVGARAEAITPRGVLVSRLGEQEVVPADSVVIAVGVRANRGLLAKLDVDRVEVHVIGDARSPRRIQQALEEGALAGRRM